MRFVLLLAGLTAKLWRTQGAPSWRELWQEFRHPGDVG